MGSGCSTDEEARHHRENKKNRSNPTESYDTWQQKMLLDIGADPLAVVRDFPRMIVYVGTEKHHNYLPQGCEHVKGSSPAAGAAAATTESARPSCQPSENPLAPSSSTQHQAEKENRKGGAAGEEARQPTNTSSGANSQDHHRLHSHRHCAKNETDQGRRPLWIETATGSRHHSSNALGATQGFSPPQPPPRLGPAGRPSQREPFRDDDAFTARMRQVREEVLLLSELCEERNTFGVAFEAAWDRLVAQGSNNDGAMESEVVSEYLATLQPQQRDGRQPTSTSAAVTAASKRTARHSVSLDVHQVLLNACVDSGMLAVASEEACHTAPTSTTLRANVGGALPGLSRTSPFGTGRNSRPQSGSASAFQLPETRTAAGLLSEEARLPADYGARDSAKKTTKKKLHRASNREGVMKSSSNSQIRSVASLATPGTPGVVAGMASRYVVRSATFHLMQFATQGVMFFPVQRLKHVLWVPWSSHMQDVSWTIHFSLKDATPSDLIALKQHTLNALYNNVSTVLPTEASAMDASGLGNPSLQNATSAVLTANRTGSAMEQNADSFGAFATTSIVSETELRAAAAANGGAGNTVQSAANTPAPAAVEQKKKRKIILIQHVQTGRHYVEEAERKTTPRYELDWACSIRVDQETLQEVFEPFQHCAVRPNRKPSPPPSPSNGATSPPASVLRPELKSEDRIGSGVTGVDSFASSPPQPQREELEENAMDVESAAAAAGFVEGIVSTQQPAVLQREVLAATVEVIAARVERPPRTMCMVSSTWKKRKEELDYVLEQQYSVHLEDADELHKKRLY